MPMRAPTCSTYSRIELSLVSDLTEMVSQSSLTKAAEWSAAHGGVPDFPVTGWSKASACSTGDSAAEVIAEAVGRRSGEVIPSQQSPSRQLASLFTGTILSSQFP